MIFALLVSYAHQIEEIFKEIHRSKRWGGFDSFSGPGSSLDQTATIREQIPVLVEELDVRTFLDIPCGDFYWMKEVKLGVDLYIGADIIGEAIDSNAREYGALGDCARVFCRLDITRDQLPQVDMVFCRDCFVHLCFDDILRAIRNIKKSNSKYLLTTTFTGLREAVDIVTGRWRPLNFQLPPFSFPDPIKVIVENCTENEGIYSDKSLALWQVPDLPS